MNEDAFAPQSGHKVPVGGSEVGSRNEVVPEMCAILLLPCHPEDPSGVVAAEVDSRESILPVSFDAWQAGIETLLYELMRRFKGKVTSASPRLDSVSETVPLTTLPNIASGSSRP